MKRLVLITSIILMYFFLLIITEANISYVLTNSSGQSVIESPHLFYSEFSYGNYITDGSTGGIVNETEPVAVVKWDRIFACVVSLVILVYYSFRFFKSKKEPHIKLFLRRNMKKLILIPSIILIYFFLAIAVELSISMEYLSSSGLPINRNSYLFYSEFFYYDGLGWVSETTTIFMWDRIFACAVSLATFTYYSFRFYKSKKMAKLPL